MRPSLSSTHEVFVRVPSPVTPAPILVIGEPPPPEASLPPSPPGSPSEAAAQASPKRLVATPSEPTAKVIVEDGGAYEEADHRVEQEAASRETELLPPPTPEHRASKVKAWGAFGLTVVAILGGARLLELSVLRRAQVADDAAAAPAAAHAERSAPTAMKAPPPVAPAPPSHAAPSSASPARVAAAPSAEIPAGMGLLKTAGVAAGHRIFVQGRVVGQTPDAVLVKCGSVKVKIGSGGEVRAIDVACGQETSLEASSR